MTIETITARSAERHTHESGSISAEEALLCPTCNQSVSQEQFEQIQVRIEGEERTRAAKIERTLQARFAAQIEKAKQEAAAREAAIRQQATKAATAALAPKIAEAEKVKKAAEAMVKEVKASQEAAISQRLLAQREALDKQKAKAISDEKAKAYEERLRLEEKLQELTRQLQKKTAHELGEPAEFDLYEILRSQFGGDNIARVGKGIKGPDIILEVVHSGTVTGSIAFDCKNHKRWQNVFTKKLRADQLAAGAEFAILSTSTFPKGARQLHIQDNVIIADPARVPVLVHLLRRHIIRNHSLKLSTEARNEKAERLYDFIISPVCGDMFNRIVKVTEDMAALDAKEADAHATTWKKRGELIRAVRNVHDQFAEVVSQITVGSEASQ